MEFMGNSPTTTGILLGIHGSLFVGNSKTNKILSDNNLLNGLILVIKHGWLENPARRGAGEWLVNGSFFVTSME